MKVAFFSATKTFYCVMNENMRTALSRMIERMFLCLVSTAPLMREYEFLSLTSKNTKTSLVGKSIS